MGNQCSRKGENAISAKLYFKIFRGSTPPYPSSSSHLRRSRLGPPINLTLLRHCFHALNTDVTFTINCEMLVHTLFCDLTQRLAFQILPRVPRFSSSLLSLCAPQDPSLRDLGSRLESTVKPTRTSGTIDAFVTRHALT